MLPSAPEPPINEGGSAGLMGVGGLGGEQGGVVRDGLLGLRGRTPEWL
ncbi:hypothetical protein ACLQ2P_17495 [Actinomadura citrea]